MIYVIILFVFEVFMSMQAVATSDTESGIVERVSRRQEGDIYFFINSSMHMSCGNENTSYLIGEDKCVKDQELFKGSKISILNHLYHISITIQDAVMLLFQLILYI
jgi:hypothetical protein